MTGNEALGGLLHMPQNPILGQARLPIVSFTVNQGNKINSTNFFLDNISYIGRNY